MNAGGRPSPATSTDLDRQLSRARGRARLVALWEVVWRRAMPAIRVVGAHVAVAWLGVYAALPPLGRWGLAALLATLLVATLVHFFAGRRTFAAALDTEAALRRVENASGLSGHELTGLTDRLAGAADPATERLWTAHRARLAARVGVLRSGWPHPDVGRRDRHALGPLVGMALFVGWFAASGEHLSRLRDPLTATTAAPTVEDRLDAWIDPPGYTGRPPLVLIGEGRPIVGTDGAEAVPAMPQGSRLVVRAASGRSDRAARPISLVVTPTGGAATEILPTASDTAATAPVDRIATLVGDSEVRILRDGATVATWRIAVTPDRPPTIRWIGRPETQSSGAMKLAHETADDWGVTSAEARFAPIGAARGRPLYAPPSFPLGLPLGRTRTGTGRTMRDVTAHPFAGARLAMTLHARDEAGQEGASETIEVTLPQRPFRKPLALALAELRRRLALDAGEIAVVTTALDALTMAPDRFEEKPGSHLGLRFVRQRAVAARDDEALREVVELLWVAATTIEDGDLADQEKALREAQEALRRALESGAPQEEIARLTAELRRAMEKFLASKAEQGRRSGRRDPSPGAQRTITERDIRRMLDRIEALARTGSHEAAEKLLEELRELMENLQAGTSAEGGEDRAGGEALEKLGDMIHRQQKLMEDTHRSRREGDGGEGKGSPEMEALGRSQKELRDALRRFSEEMGERGEERGATPGRRGEPSGEGGDDLGAAADAMGRAGEALERGEGEAALEAQSQALEGLRRGARKLVDKMSRRGEGGREGDEDPLGRPRRQDGTNDSDRVKVPDEIDVERARRVLDEIRRRLGEPARPKFERDYLDRLLRLDSRDR